MLKPNAKYMEGQQFAYVGGISGTATFSVVGFLYGRKLRGSAPPRFWFNFVFFLLNQFAFP